MSGDYKEFCEALRIRAKIRRSIPRGEPDRIADAFDRAAEALEGLVVERDHWHQAYKDLLSEKQQMELGHVRQQIG